MKIVTTDHGPTVYRNCQWTAIEEDTYDGAPDSGCNQVGHGDTEIEATFDLLAQLLDTEAHTNYEPLFSAFCDVVGLTRDEEIELMSSDHEPERARNIIREAMYRTQHNDPLEKIEK